MSDLIDRQAFIENERKLYCEDCDRRKGTKNGKPNVICYEIGEAPCRACWLDDALDDLEDFPASSPWHRVEEKPKKHGKYPVCWVENGNFYWQEAHYCYYQDGDKWVAWSSYQGDDVEITPDYWMPIEPPKEENDA
jgi:hypothetical protein